MGENTQVYRFFWLDGKIDEHEGENAADAISKLGYGQGALRALDYWKIKEEE